MTLQERVIAKGLLTLDGRHTGPFYLRRWSFRGRTYETWSDNLSLEHNCALPLVFCACCGGLLCPQHGKLVRNTAYNYTQNLPLDDREPL